MNVPIPLYALVVKEEKKLGKNGCYWQVVLRTEIGQFNANMWNAGDDVYDSPLFPHKGELIEVCDFKDQLETFNSIVINSFKHLEKENLPDGILDSIMNVEKASKEDTKWALDLIGDSSFWVNPEHHAFVVSCLANLDKQKLMSCPAATGVHHSYNGGLVVHTAEVLELAKSVVEASARRYAFVNRDVVYAGAILHDIGKVETYYIDDVGVSESLVTERTIGHLFYGMNLIQNTSRDYPHLQKFRDEVMHVVASHHGRVEWGSIKEVLSLEAGIISRVDYISSRNGMVEKELQSYIKSKALLPDNFRVYGDKYFATTGMKKYMESE